MDKKTMDEINIEFPEKLEIDNTLRQIIITNNQAAAVEIKLYPETETSANVNSSWYKIAPESLTIARAGE